MARLVLCVGVTLILGCGGGQAAERGESSTSETSTTSSGTELDSESSTETGEPESCGHVSIAPSHTPPLIMFVVDKSQSMLATWDHDGDPGTPEQTRWASAWEIVEGLASAWDQAGVLGVQLFPSADACPGATSMTPSCEDASACSLAAAPEVALAEDNAVVVIGALPSQNTDPVKLAGASPATAAYLSAVDHVEDLLASYEDSAAYVLLLTDGHVNCGADLDAPESFAVHDDQLAALIQSTYEVRGIRTATIAIDEDAELGMDLGADTIPGFDPRPWLEELGQVGGLSNHPGNETAYFSASDVENILSFFQTPDTIGDCVVDLSMTEAGPPTPEQVPLVTWERNGEPLPFVEYEVCASEDGWTWLEGDNWEPGVLVKFCGQACEDFKDGAASFDGDYGCPPQN